jgi:hypothetical protein
MLELGLQLALGLKADLATILGTVFSGLIGTLGALPI